MGNCTTLEEMVLLLKAPWAGRYDPSGNSWTFVNSYRGTIACKFASVVNFQGFLFVIGGNNKNGVNSNVHKYNPETNLWQEAAPLSFARCGICAVADKDSLFAIGGKSGGEFLNVVETFDPERNCWSQIASTIERKALSCGAISRDKVFVFGVLLAYNHLYIVQVLLKCMILL